MKASRGVICYNAGRKCLVRMAVMLHTLRRHWCGDICVLAEDDEGLAGAREIAARHKAACRVPAWKTQVPEGPNTVFLHKTLVHEVTPFDLSAMIDLDVTVHGDIAPLFDAADDTGFAIARFSDWGVTSRRIGKRIMPWAGIVTPEHLAAAKRYPAAINTGVYAFARDSQLMADWYGLCVQRRGGFIPDETCCQVMLGTWPHVLLDGKYNISCKYALKSHQADPVIMHYHGRKHCRIERDDGKSNRRTVHHLRGGWNFLASSDWWYPHFEAIRGQKWVRRYIRDDRQLRHYIGKWDEAKQHFRKEIADAKDGSHEN